jgi:hypothetical protein
VQLQSLLCVFADCGHERRLVTALGYTDIDLGPAEAPEPFTQFRVVAGILRYQYFTRDPALDLAVFPVDLLQQVLDEFRRRGVLHFLHHPTALSTDTAAADMEHLHGGLEFVVMQGEDVGVGIFREDHGVAFEDLAQGDDVVPEPGCPLIVEFGHGGRHVLFKPADEAFGFATHEGTEILRKVPVFLGSYASHARGRAFVDVSQKARAPAGCARLKTPALQLRTGKTRSKVSIVSRMAPAV